jgi:hypothetical protein
MTGIASAVLPNLSQPKNKASLSQKGRDKIAVTHRPKDASSNERILSNEWNVQDFSFKNTLVEDETTFPQA